MRARQGLKTPDAIQAASALVWQQQGPQPQGVLFVKGDLGFAKVLGLQVRQITVPA